MDKELQDLNKQVMQVHDRVDVLFRTAKIPSMLMSEYKNKVSQYENMIESVETMKKMAGSGDAVEKLIFQEKEILNRRMKCELELARKAQACL